MTSVQSSDKPCLLLGRWAYVISWSRSGMNVGNMTPLKRLVIRQKKVLEKLKQVSLINQSEKLKQG